MTDRDYRNGGSWNDEGRHGRGGYAGGGPRESGHGGYESDYAERSRNGGRNESQQGSGRYGDYYNQGDEYAQSGFRQSGTRRGGWGENDQSGFGGERYGQGNDGNQGQRNNWGNERYGAGRGYGGERFSQGQRGPSSGQYYGLDEGRYAFGEGNRSSARGEWTNGWSNDFGLSSRGGRDDWARGSHAGKGPRGYKRSDDRIREDVSDRLMQDHHIDASDIEVRVQEGRVTLEGSVDSRDIKHRAEDLVESVSGVQDISNNLRVKKENEQRAAGSSQTVQAGSESHEPNGQRNTRNSSAQRS